MKYFGIRRRLAARALGVVFLAMGSVIAQAQEGGGWQCELTPYFTLAGINGSVRPVGGKTISISASPGDLLTNLDVGGSVAFEARHGRWGVVFDGIYMKLSKNVTLRDSLYSSVDVGVKSGITSIEALYRAADQKDLTVDVVGGVRFWATETKLDYNEAQLPAKTVTNEKNWTDPVIGSRLKVGLADDLKFNALLDLGGFAVSSRFTYQVYLGAEYRFNDDLSGKFGYRLMGIDYDNEGYTNNLLIHGLTVGVTITF